MHHRPSTTRQRSSPWARLAAFFSFLAVFAALSAPASMLAEEVRTGKLGGICSLNTPASSAVEAGNPDSNSAPRLMAQCDLCGASGLALPSFEATSFQPAVPGEVCAFSDATRLCNAVPGLPFGRGPPSGENQGLALA